MAGKIIVLDGLDGVGKQTQTELLKVKFEEIGVLVKVLDFPQYDSFWGQFIKQTLQLPPAELAKIPAKLLALPFALDRLQFKDQLNSWLAAGEIIVLDRYVSSNLIYATARLKSSLEIKQTAAWLEEFEYQQLGLPEADLTLFLDLPLEVSCDLIKQRGRQGDSFEAQAAWQAGVKNSIKHLLPERRRWQLIDCYQNSKLLSKSKVSQLVWQAIARLK